MLPTGGFIAASLRHGGGGFALWDLLDGGYQESGLSQPFFSHSWHWRWRNRMSDCIFVSGRSQVIQLANMKDTDRAVWHRTFSQENRIPVLLNEKGKAITDTYHTRKQMLGEKQRMQQRNQQHSKPRMSTCNCAFRERKQMLGEQNEGKDSAALCQKYLRPRIELVKILRAVM
jgi:hypothetical protein